MTSADVWRHLREEPEDLGPEEKKEIEMMQKAAIDMVKSYTGLADAQLDEHEDITIAVLMLVADMYDNRQMQVDKNNMNRTAETILNMHSVNLL